MTAPLIRIKHLSKRFERRRGLMAGTPGVCAVRDVSLCVDRGKTLGIVGESGCGKSTLGRMAVGLLAPSGGEVYVNGRALWNKAEHTSYAAFRRSLAGVLQMVFQDPHSSLNPRMRIGNSVAEPLLCSDSWREGRPVSRAGIKRRVAEILGQVGLGEDAAGRYPHEFSGGQRQRVAIARALVTRPACVVCDEPTSSLDASVQSQVLNLLRDMQAELGLAYVFISHDLAVVRHMSDHVAVMYMGLVVEEGEAESLFARPAHPYTRLLLESVPGLGGDLGSFEESGPGERAAFPESRDGCPFAARCPDAYGACFTSLPELTVPAGAEIAGRRVRCRLFEGR